MPTVLREDHDGVAIITLNRPAEYNALDDTLMRELDTVTAAVSADADIRAILITGAGKGFCSGAQLGGDLFESGADIGARMRRHLHPTLERLRAGRIPVVTAVNGAAAGAGVGLALAGDIVLAARSARFILSFARLGAALDAGTSLLVQRAIGVPRARALALLAEPLDAQQAADWGLIWRCVDDDQLGAEALHVARHLAGGPALGLGMIKTQLNNAWATSFTETLDHEADTQSLAFITGDLKEGYRAFLEKRPPVFRGR